MNSRRVRVAYWNNMPSPYIVGRLNALAKRANIEVEGWFNERRREAPPLRRRSSFSLSLFRGGDGAEPERRWNVNESQWEFRGRYIQLIETGKVKLQIPTKELQEFQPDVVLSLYASPSFATGSMVAKATGARTVFRVLPTYESWVERTRSKEFVKKFLFRTVDAVETPGPQGRAFAVRYGLPAERAYFVTQSVDVKHFSEGSQLSETEREKMRAKLGLSGCVFLYVGRLWSGKGLDYLFQAYRSLLEGATIDASLLLVGDGMEEDRYRQLAKDLRSVVFVGFVQQDDLPRYYGLADVLVFPTLGDPHGLVVEEAMAAGLPVISSAAAGDISLRVLDGNSGYIVPPRNSVVLCDRMRQLASLPALRSNMSSEARALVQNRNHERWAEDFETLAIEVMNRPARKNAATALARAIGRAVSRLLVSSRDGTAPPIGNSACNGRKVGRTNEHSTDSANNSCN
jgi:glycosyltransferase involved in cell wall biosynthesis